MFKLLLSGIAAAAIFLSSGIFLVVSTSESEARAVKSRECRADLRKFRKKDRFAAFAVSRNGLACGMAWRYPTIKQARREAVRQCRLRRHPGCRVIRTSTRKRARRLIGERCKRAFARWKQLNAYRAFAMTSHGSSCGWSWGQKSMRRAVSGALKECRKHGPGCRIIARTGPGRKKRRP